MTDPPDFQPLDPAIVTVDRIGGYIFTSIVAVGCLVGLTITYFASGFNHVGFWIAVLVMGLVICLLAWSGHVYPRLSFQNARWRLTASGLEIHRGVWWRSQIGIPLSRVQHTDVQQGPLLRRFGIATLIVHTAGTESPAIQLEGLSVSMAHKLRDALIENRGSIDGV